GSDRMIKREPFFPHRERLRFGWHAHWRTWRSHHILSPAGLDFSAPDLAIAPRPSTARKANAAGMKKISGRPTVATPRAPVRPPRALLTAVELMKIAVAVATAVGSNRCAAMMPSDAKIPQTPPIRIADREHKSPGPKTSAVLGPD